MCPREPALCLGACRAFGTPPREPPPPPGRERRGTRPRGRVKVPPPVDRRPPPRHDAARDETRLIGDRLPILRLIVLRHHRRPVSG
jgi:hypothetical protein